MARDPLDLPPPTREGAEVELLRTLPSGTKDFGGATKARVRAIDVLFEADARDLDIAPLAEERTRTSAAQTTLPPAARALALVYAEHAGDVDDALSSHSESWQLGRMPAVDRAILRMGTAEILYTEGTDVVILIKEYTRIASELSTDNSAPFVNALLQRMADMKELLS
ncbi:MAG: transcription antitermination factor NusB [Dermabacter sp.]|nr:transcription antitermination factor NusB [Dermabacter sp.]